MAKKYLVYNEDCVLGAKKHLKDESVDLVITDPPFGISESKFDKHYNRKGDNVIQGYVEAPTDYDAFTTAWMTEATRVLKPNGSMFIVIGHSNLLSVLQSAKGLGLTTINHLIWKYNFGVATKKKFVTSHYHILYFTKPKAKPTFNTYCRFGPQEKHEGKSVLYSDLEDVFFIKKEYQQNKIKNVNKLPEALIKKIMLYASNPGDVVADFFMGSFTTARVAIQTGRFPVGFELNKNAFKNHRLNDVKRAADQMVKVVLPNNQGKKISSSEKEQIKAEFQLLIQSNTKKKSIELLSKKFERGKFSIINLVTKDKT